MRLQSTPASCGQASLANALRALGFDITEERVQRWMDSLRQGNNPSEGTTEHLMIRVVAEKAKRGLLVKQVHVADPAIAVSSLRGLLLGGSVAMLAVEDDDHWVTAIGILGTRFLICDPADSELVLSLTPEQLLARWEKTGNPATYYALVITKGGSRASR